MASVTRTIRYAWRTFTENYSVNCTDCGKLLTRSVSSGCNELADRDYVDKLRERLKAQAQEESGKPVTCSTCLAGRIHQVQGFTPLDPSLLDHAEELNARVRATRSEARALETHLNETYKNRVFTRRGEEWAACYFSVGDNWRDVPIVVHADRINKRQPWLVTNHSDTLDIRECAFSEQTLNDRIQAVMAKRG